MFDPKPSWLSHLPGLCKFIHCPDWVLRRTKSYKVVIPKVIQNSREALYTSYVKAVEYRLIVRPPGKTLKLFKLSVLGSSNLKFWQFSLVKRRKIENCPKFILQHAHIYNLYDNWWNVFLKVQIMRAAQHLLRWITFSLQTQAHLAHRQTTPTFIFIFSLIFHFRIFHAYFQLIEI